jgi:hypothetical protein
MWLLGLAPLALLAAFSLLVAKTGVLEFLRRGVPPVEELTFDRVTLAPNLIRVDVVNGGPDPVTVAQVQVDEAFWEYTISPAPSIGRLGRARIEIPFPWVKNEPHEIKLVTSTGLTFAYEIAVATTTPQPGPRLFAVFALVGLYVGVIPVAIGLLWYPLLRGLEPRWLNFALALTAGLLIFLGVDAVHEALEAAGQVAGAFQGVLLVVVGSVGTLLLLQMISRARLNLGGLEGRKAVAFLIALGIGLSSDSCFTTPRRGSGSSRRSRRTNRGSGRWWASAFWLVHQPSSAPPSAESRTPRSTPLSFSQWGPVLLRRS